MELTLPNDPEREFVISTDTAHVRASRAEAGLNFEIAVARCGRSGRGSCPGRYFTTADTSSASFNRARCRPCSARATRAAVR